MAKETNPFIDSEMTSEIAANTNAQPEAQVNLQPETEVNLQHIRVNDDIVSGPLVVFFGPRDIGKTVTLIRLCNYIKKYEIRANPNFRTDKVAYKRTTDMFEALRKNSYFAPGSTGNIDFLLLDVTYHGNTFCQILEAPGEHFFDAENPDRDYPAYFHQILNSDYRKVFVFFFELNMFSSDQDRRNYADKIARLTSEKVRSKRDRVIIVCNKADLHPFLRNGSPVLEEYKNALYKSGAFSKLLDVLSKGGYGRIPFVPFSAGAFTDDGSGKLAFAPSSAIYPEKLWGEVYQSVEGKPWWKLW